MEINFEGALSKEDYDYLVKLISSNRRVRPLFVIIIFLFFIIAIVMNYSKDRNLSYFMIFMIVFFVFAIMFRKYRNKKYWKESKAIKEHCSGVVNDQGIVINSETWSSNKTWEYFSKYKESPEMVLLYQSYAVTHVLPRTFFKNDSDWISFVEIVQNKVASK